MHDKKLAVVFRTKFLPYSETFIHDELRHHVRYNVTVLTKMHLNENLFPGHQVVSLKNRALLNRVESYLFKKWFFSWTFNHEFSGKNINVIHAHFATGGVYMIPFSLRYKLPLVVSLHGKDVSLLISKDIYLPKYKFYLNNYRKLFNVASLFLAASQDLKDIVVSCGCPEEKVIVYRLGIDLTKFTPKEHEVLNTHKVVMVGRLVEKKGFEFGIRAFAKIIHQGVDA
ncbi:glycosyltransferase, partial [bacterium]